MTKPLGEVTQHLRDQLAMFYGPRLKGIYVYGSYARGEEDDESDLDVLVVLDRIDHYVGEIDRSGRIIADLSLEYEVSISRTFVSEEQWRTSDTFFLQNVREEAVPA